MIDIINTTLGVFSGVLAILVFFFNISTFQELKTKIALLFSRDRNVTEYSTANIEITTAHDGVQDNSLKLISYQVLIVLVGFLLFGPLGAVIFVLLGYYTLGIIHIKSVALSIVIFFIMVSIAFT